MGWRKRVKIGDPLEQSNNRVLYKMDSKKLQLFTGIMGFYILLAHVVFPLGFYYLVEKSLQSAGNGFVLGSLVSIALWYFYGRKLVK